MSKSNKPPSSKLTSQTLEFSLKTFEARMRALMQKVGNPGFVLTEAEKVAWKFLSKAIFAPIPRDTGELARSQAVVRNDQQNTVVFGFNKIYASIQDLGSRDGKRLPAKPYGSALGPNHYFSETFRRNQAWFLDEVVKGLKRDLGKDFEG